MIHFFTIGDAANSFALMNEQRGNRVYFLPRRMPNNLLMYHIKFLFCFHMPCSCSHPGVNTALNESLF